MKLVGAIPSSDEGLDKVLSAAARAVARLGVYKVAMDDIAAEAEMSRATLYRRFGSRDAIIAALISEQARPFVEDAIRLSAGAESFAEQMEINTVQAVLNINQYEAIAAIFAYGNYPQNLRLIRPVYRELVMVILIPSLEAARESGELRDGLDNEEVAEWLMREFLLLVSEGDWTEHRLRRRVRQFLLPVLLKDNLDNDLGVAATKQPAEQRLDNMEKRLSEIQQAVAMISHSLLDK